MTFESFFAPILVVWVTNMTAIISPGPSFLVTARTTLARGPAAGTACALGIATGTLVWASAALAGLALVFKWLPELLAALKLAGGVYLLYLAIMLMRHAEQPLAIAPDQGATRRVQPGYWLGLAVQLANPKAAVFFGTIFVALLPAEPPPAMGLIVVMLAVVSEGAWFSLVAQILGNTRLRQRYQRAKTGIDRTTGVLLGLIGLYLLLD